MVSWAAKTPCIQQVAHSVVSSGSMPWPDRSSAPWRRAHDPFLLAQHDVAVVRPVGHEERQQPAVAALFVHALGKTLCERVFVERIGDERRCILQHAPGRHAQRNLRRARSPPGRACAVSILRQVGIARRLGMIRLVEAEERPRRLRVRLQRDGP